MILRPNPFKVRCSSIGALMTEPRSIDPVLITPQVAEILSRTSAKRTDEEKAHLQELKDQTLSETAKTHVLGLLSQDIFGVDFEINGRALEKGLTCEDEAIGLLNRVRGLSLQKNKIRRENEWITGECDLLYPPTMRGHDIKCSWSVQTFPIVLSQAINDTYLWQMRGYMWLWDAESWEVNYVLLNTPEELRKYETEALHSVDHIPERMRLTSWTIQRDRSVEPLIATKVDAARDFYRQALAEFEFLHDRHPQGDEPMPAPPPRAVAAVHVRTPSVKPSAPTHTWEPAMVAPALALIDPF